jgi:hypothetical protein
MTHVTQRPLLSAPSRDQAGGDSGGTPGYHRVSPSLPPSCCPWDPGSAARASRMCLHMCACGVWRRQAGGRAPVWSKGLCVCGPCRPSDDHLSRGCSLPAMTSVFTLVLSAPLNPEPCLLPAGPPQGEREEGRGEQGGRRGKGQGGMQDREAGDKKQTMSDVHAELHGAQAVNTLLYKSLWPFTGRFTPSPLQHLPASPSGPPAPLLLPPTHVCSAGPGS